MAAPGAAGSPRREKTPGWWLLAAVVVPFLRLVGRYEFRNLDGIPRSGPFVLSPNHYSNFDPLVTAYTVWRSGRVPRFLAKASLFRVPVVGAILRASGQIPVERAGRPSSASTGPQSPIGAGALAPVDGHAPSPMSAASRLVDEGLAVIVYPEGTLTREPDLWPMRGKSGAVRLALEHDVPLIPCAHWGVQAIMPRYGRLSLVPRKPVTVVIGEPLDLSPWRGRPITPDVLAEATEALMVAITALLAGLRGEEPPAERWDPTAHGQAETGKLDA